MNYKAHQIGGICAATIASTYLYHQGMSHGEASTYVTAGLMIVGGAIGGVLPDIDHPTSKVGKRVKPISVMINKLFGHRGFTHTILALLLFTYGLFLISTMLPVIIKGYYLAITIGLSVGYLSHILIDLLTISGLPLLYPISNKTFRLAKLHTGRDDPFVILFSLIGTGILVYSFFKL